MNPISLRVLLGLGVLTLCAALALPGATRNSAYSDGPRMDPEHLLRARGARGSAVLVVPLLETQSIDVTAAQTTGNRKKIQLDVPELEYMGPHLESIQAHVVIHTASSSNFQLDLASSWTVDGSAWFDTTSILGTPMTSASPGKVAAALTDTTKWGPRMAYTVEAWTSGANEENAVVSIYLAVRLKT